MPVGGLALVVPGSWWSWVRCDEFAGLSPPAQQRHFSSQGQGHGEFLGSFLHPKCSFSVPRLTRPFFLGEKILCSAQPPPFWASVPRRWLEIEEPVRSMGWRVWNNHTQDDSCRVSPCVPHAAYAYFILRQITCVTKSVRK